MKVERLINASCRKLSISQKLRNVVILAITLKIFLLAGLVCSSEQNPDQGETSDLLIIDDSVPADSFEPDKAPDINIPDIMPGSKFDDNLPADGSKPDKVPDINNPASKFCGQANCTFYLPLFVTGGSGDPDLDEPLNEPLVKLDSDQLAKHFPAGANLEYSIISGNPSYMLQKTGKNGVLKKYPQVGYRIDNKGEIYVRDAWLLGRDSPLYSLTDEQHHFFSRGRNWHPLQNLKACGGSSSQACPDGQEYRFNRYYTDYTLGRTEDSIIKIQVRDSGKSDSREFDVTIKAHPHAVKLAQECKQSDNIDRWICRHAREIIPNAAVKTTGKHRENLPEGLARSKDIYDLVANIEFTSLQETKRYLKSQNFDDGSKLAEVKNGELILHHKVTRIEDDNKMCDLKSSLVTSLGLFEPGSGYLEFNFTKYPNLSVNGGNLLIWSRYGSGQGAFPFEPPTRLFEGMKVVNRSLLAKLGFIEIDLLERWRDNMSAPWFVIHTYPIQGTLFDGTIPVKPASNGYTNKPQWVFRPVSGGQSHLLNTIIGIELVPGGGSQIYKNGKSQFTAHKLKDFFAGAGVHFLIHGIYNKNGFLCKDLSNDLQISLDYIRLYQPRNGY